MLSLRTYLLERLVTATHQAFPLLPHATEHVELTQATNSRFGHYQSNMAMKLSKIIGKPPREIATNIAQALQSLPDNGIAQLEIAGPGFLNITLNNDLLAAYAMRALQPRCGIPPVSKPKKIIIDFSSPNIAKEMHVGHLRSTIIGDSLARMFEFVGDDVLRLNHLGDWGTQFGMLIAYLKQFHPTVVQGTRSTTLSELVVWYKEAKQLFDTDEQFAKQAQQEVVALQQGEATARKIWQQLCIISARAYQEIYQLLDVRLVDRGESFYNAMLPAIVSLLQAKGLTSLSDGATCVFLPGFTGSTGEPLPLIVQKTDGGFNYATTDLAALQQRITVEQADRIIYITDAGQALHFSMVFATARAAGFFDARNVIIDHAPFGLVCGTDGKKFRTRSGDVEKLIDLLHNAIDAATVIVREKNPTMPMQEQDALAQIIGIAAIKYNDLSYHRTSDYIFSYETMLKLEGNTAPFVLYSFVRCRSIVQKAGVSVPSSAPIQLEHPSEIALAVHIAQLAETIETATTQLLPNRMTDYLYNLATAFNAFFRDCHVVGSEQQASRLALCQATANTLQLGLSLLGIQTVERM
ncbi:arginine--tRNA ligase [Candidatus Dependentiae bacterium]|nr:arginine--tRNA ligase [Candidatus Dependentiae bacterium]